MKKIETWWYKYCQDEKKVLGIIFPDSVKELKRKTQGIFLLGGLLIALLGILLFPGVLSYLDVDVDEIAIVRGIYLLIAVVSISLIAILHERRRRRKKMLKILSDPRNEEIYAPKLEE